MSSRTEAKKPSSPPDNTEAPTRSDWLAGGALLLAGLFLLSVYSEGQLHHTMRFFYELLLYLDRLLGSP